LETGKKKGELKFDYINDLNLNYDQSKIVLVNTAYQKKERVVIDIESMVVVSRVKTNSDDAYIRDEPSDLRKYSVTYKYENEDKNENRYFRINLSADSKLGVEDWSYFFKVNKKDDFLSEPFYLQKDNSILFTYCTKKENALYRKEADSEAPPQLIYSSPNELYSVSASPDGKFILVNQDILNYKDGKISELGKINSEMAGNTFSHSIYYDGEVERLLVYSEYENTAELFDYTGTLISKIRVNLIGQEKPYRMTHNFKTNQFAYSSKDNYVHILDLLTGKKAVDLLESTEEQKKNEAAAAEAARVMAEAMKVSEEVNEKRKEEAKGPALGQYCYCAILKKNSLNGQDIHVVFVDIKETNGTEANIKAFGKRKAMEIAANGFSIDSEQLSKNKPCLEMKSDVSKLVSWSDFRVLRFDDMSK